jgi:hypothetical protein
MTCRTGDRILPLRSSSTFAGFARILSRDFDLGLDAEGSFAERDFQIVSEIGASFRTTRDHQNIAIKLEYISEIAGVGRNR